MIHYSCDLCHRPLDPETDLRYVVRIEMYPALDPPAEDGREDDRDHLLEIHEALECAYDSDATDYSDSYQELRFDLCPQCRTKFANDPLRREVVTHFDFSEN